ncbi:UNVERIFIED_CONTAM: hypothetical protein PYX00_008046 [Menopon gallinae]|uniref:Secretory carrier-associated membrane protein n=1 Tax=Menopon gallinae TaxID=328185 RepID=A0AAW2HLQ7_9NEOP
MSGFEDNFFENTDDNPFNDPSVTAVTHHTAKNQSGLEGYAPFSGSQPSAAAGPPAAGPAIMHPTTQDVSPTPPQYNKSGQQQVPNYTFEELERQKRELDIKKAMLDEREERLRNSTHNVRKNNWPPLPDNFCVQPCFYQDINVDIQPVFQRVVRHLYYVWLFHGCVLVLNVLGGLALLVHDGDFVTFGVGILYLIIFTPFSFLCWYRPAYKAFRDDSSLNFMVFFFVFFFQFIVTAVLAFGIAGAGACGIAKVISCFSPGEGKTLTAGRIVVGIIVLFVALAFLTLAAAEMFLLTKIHRIYRSSGASVAKAQMEFTKEFLRNEHVQSATTDVAAATLRAQMDGFQQPNRR